MPEGFAGRLEAVWPAVLERCVELAGGRERVTRDAFVQVGECGVMCLGHQDFWAFVQGSRAGTNSCSSLCQGLQQQV